MRAVWSGLYPWPWVLLLPWRWVKPLDEWLALLFGDGPAVPQKWDAEMGGMLEVIVFWSDVVVS